MGVLREEFGGIYLPVSLQTTGFSGDYVYYDCMYIGLLQEVV